MEDLYPSRHRPEPGRLERTDPVVWASDLQNPPIALDLIRQYERDGFLVLENVFDGNEVAALKAGADQLRANPGDLTDGTLIAEPGTSGQEAVRSVFAIHQQSETFGALAASERLAGLARYLLADDVYIHQSRLNYKPAFRGKEFYWHSDFETWHVEDGMPRMRAVSMSVLLTDNHPQAGPTMFVPGSQNDYIQCVGKTPDNHYKSSLRKQEYGVPDPEGLAKMVDRAGIVAPAPTAGSVVLFDCNTMHGSNGNITPFERVNAFFVFNAWSNRLVEPFGQIQPRPEFIAHRQTDTPLPPDIQRNPRAA